VQIERRRIGRCRSPKAREATKSFEKLLKWIQESTERGPWLAGPDFSLADIAATPYMVRPEILKLNLLLSGSEFTTKTLSTRRRELD
jgi:glutathione S-transferase